MRNSLSMWGHFCCRHIGKDILDSVPATVEEGGRHGLLGQGCRMALCL